MTSDESSFGQYSIKNAGGKKIPVKQLRFLAAIALVVLLVMVLTNGCQSRTESKLIYGLTLAPSGIDPHVNASSELGIPLTSVYDPLVWQAPTGGFVPGLAKSWEVSADGTEYTFYLRPDVTFHDGEPFNARAVQINFERIFKPETKSQKAAFMLGSYEGCEIIDEYTIKVRLSEPFAPFLDSLSQVYLGMASPAALEKWGADYQLHQVGTGPFIFQEYVPKDHLTLVRNPDYKWGPSFFQHEGPAYLEEIEFRFYVEPATRAPALESGDVHIVGEVPPQDASRLEADERFDVMQVAIPGTPLTFFMNTERPPTDDLSVRQAILHALDRPAIVQTVFMGTSPVADGPLCANTPGYSSDVKGLYSYDPDRARELLDQVGWIDGNNDGIREKNGQPLIIEAYLMSWGYIPEVAQIMQEQLKAVGMEMKSSTVAYPAALEAGREGKHNLMPFSLSSSDPDILRTFFESGNADAGFNWAKVRDARIDELLAEGISTRSAAGREAIYAEIQQRVMGQALIIPIRDYVNLNGVSARVRGLCFDAGGWFPWLHDVQLSD